MTQPHNASIHLHDIKALPPKDEETQQKKDEQFALKHFTFFTFHFTSPRYQIKRNNKFKYMFFSSPL